MVFVWGVGIRIGVWVRTSDTTVIAVASSYEKQGEHAKEAKETVGERRVQRFRSRKAREKRDPVGSGDERNAARVESGLPEAIRLRVHTP